LLDGTQSKASGSTEDKDAFNIPSSYKNAEGVTIVLPNYESANIIGNSDSPRIEEETRPAERSLHSNSHPMQFRGGHRHYGGSKPYERKDFEPDRDDDEMITLQQNYKKRKRNDGSFTEGNRS